MKRFPLILLVLSIFVVSACTPSAPITVEQTSEAQLAAPAETAAPAEATPTQALEPYPGPPTPFVYTPPYPIEPQAAEYPDVPFITPAPVSGKGVLVGHVVDVESGESMGFQSIYLGYKIPFADGVGYSIAIQEQSSPHTFTDKQGRFAIGDIEPGIYLILVWTPMDATVVMDPDTDSEMEVTIKAGEILDIGTIQAIDPLTTNP